MRRATRQYIKGWGWLLPALVLYLIFGIIPVFQGIRLSFYKASLRYTEFTGLRNYAFLLDSMEFQKAVQNTIGYVLVCVPISVILPLGLAITINKMRECNQAVMRFLFYLPYLGAGVVLAVIWKWIYAVEGGALNPILGLFGVQPIVWLATNSAAFWAICITVIFGGTGVNILIYLAGIATIDPGLYEVAMLDGCKQGQVTRYVTLPHLRPYVVLLLIVRTIGTFQIWGTVHMLTRGGPAWGTTTMVYVIYHQGIQNSAFGLASAASILLFLGVAVLVTAQFLIVRRRK